MESAQFKGPHPPNEALLLSSNIVINPERSETPDSNNDSATSSPRIIKPVLGKAQAKKRLMAFANKYIAPVKSEKAKDKLSNANKNQSLHSNQSKKKPTDSVKLLITEVKEAKSRIESELEIRERNEVQLQRHSSTSKTTMKKRSEPKMLAIEEIIREESKQRQLMVNDNSSKESNNYDKHSKIERNDRNNDEDRHSNWDRRNSSIENFNRSSNRDIESRKSDKRQRHSDERKDSRRNKEKKEKDHHHRINQSRSISLEKEPHSSMKTDGKMDRNRDKSRHDTIHKGERKKEQKEELAPLIKCNSWSDFKSKGGRIRDRSLSENACEDFSKDLKCKTPHDYNTHLEQMLMLGTHRLERTRAIADGINDEKKEYPPESIRVTKKTKGSSVLYSENPLVSLLFFRQQLFELLPPERCSLMREISDATGENIKDDDVTNEHIRCWFKNLKDTNEEERSRKMSVSSSAPILLPKSKWDSEDETTTVASNSPIQHNDAKVEAEPEKLEESTPVPMEPTQMMSNVVSPENDTENDSDVVKNLCDEDNNESGDKENPDLEIGEKLVSEYEQFMKIVSNETTALGILEDRYSPKESLQGTVLESDVTNTPPNIKDSIAKTDQPIMSDIVSTGDNNISTAIDTQKASITPENSNFHTDDMCKDGKTTKDDEVQSTVELNSDASDWENIRVKVERPDDENYQLSKNQKGNKKKDRKKKKKKLPSSESSDSTSSDSSSESESEKRKKKQKKRRKKKRTRDSSSDSSSSSSDDSSSDDVSKKRRRRKKKRKSKKKSHSKKKRSRKDSTDSDSSSSDLEELMRKRKRRKKDSRKYGTVAKQKRSKSRSKSRSESRSKSRSESRSKSIDKKRSQKIKKERENVETGEEVSDLVYIKQEKSQSPEWQHTIEISKAEVIANVENSTKPELMKPLEENTKKEKYCQGWDNDSLLAAQSHIKVEKMETKLEDSKDAGELTKTKSDIVLGSEEDSVTVTEVSHYSSLDATPKNSAEVSNEPINSIDKNEQTDQNEVSRIHPPKLSSKQRSRSTSTSSSNSSASTSSSGSTGAKTRGEKTASTKLLMKKLKKYQSKWPASVDFDSLNFPSLTQLDQKVSQKDPSIDDWEVDSMDGIDDIATTSKQKSLTKREQKKIEKQVRYDHETDTYIAVEKKLPRESKKKPPSRICALRIWEDEEEEGEREAIMLLEEKTKTTPTRNLTSWQPETESFAIAPKIELKKKKDLKGIKSPSSTREGDKKGQTGWVEIIPEGGINLPAELPPQQRTEVSRWTDSSVNIGKSEEELVPVNWEEEEATWIPDIKSISSRVDGAGKPMKNDLEKKSKLNHGMKTIHSIDKRLYSPSSPASQKSEAGEASTDSSSDSTDTSSSSESSDTDAESLNEHPNKSENTSKKLRVTTPNIPLKDTVEESYAETEAMKKLRMDMFAEFAAHDSRNKTPDINNDLNMHSEDLNHDLELDVPTSSLTLIPPQLLTRRNNESIKTITHSDRRPSFKSIEHHMGPNEKISTLVSIHSSSPSTNADKSSVPEIPLLPSRTSNVPDTTLPTNIKTTDDSQFVGTGAHSLDSTAEREAIRRGFHNISPRDSRSLSRESKRRFSPQRDKEKSKNRSSEERGSSSSYLSNSRGTIREIDRDRNRTVEKCFKESVFDGDRRNLSPFIDRDPRDKRRASPAGWSKPRSRSRSWSRSRSRSPKRRDDRSSWDRQKPRAKYFDDRRERFSRSPARGRLPPLVGRDRGRRQYDEGGIERERSREKDWSIDRNIEKPYDPIEMLRGAYSVNKKRENEPDERPRWREEEANVGRDGSDTLDMMYVNRPAPDINIGDRMYRRSDSLERDLLEGPILPTDFDRPRYRSRSRERRNRDSEWNRSRESSVSDRFGSGSRRGKRLSETRSRCSRISPRPRCSPLRKPVRGRYMSRSRSRSWTRSRSRTRSRTRSRSRSISRSRSRSRTRSISSSRSRSRSGRRSLDRAGRSGEKLRRSRSFSPASQQSRKIDDERYRRSTSREPGRRIETIVHPTGMNPMPPECSPLASDTNMGTPTAHFEYSYYGRNNLTYPPRLEAPNPPSGSPKRLSLDDRLELELGIKKHQEAPTGVPPTFNHPGFNPHMLSYPPPPTGTPLLVPRNVATQSHGAYNCPPPTVLQVGNVLQVVPGDFNVPTVVPAIRNNIPCAITSESNNSNRVVRVGNVLQVVPSTTHDWTAAAPPPSTAAPRHFDAKTLNKSAAVPIALPVPLTPAANITPTLPASPLPIPTSVVIPLIHAPPTPVPTPSPIAVLPKLEPPKAPPVIQPVYNYEAIMEDRQKEKMERKKLREEKRQEKKRRKNEKIQRRAKRTLGRTSRVTDAVNTEPVTEETEYDVTPSGILTALADDDDPDDTVTATLGETDEVTAEIEDEEEEEEDEEGDVDEDDEEEEEDDEPEEEVEGEEPRLISDQPAQQRDIESTVSIDGLNPECSSESSTIPITPVIPLLPPPKKGILIPAGLWSEQSVNGAMGDADDDDSGNAVDRLLSQECNDESMIGDLDEERSGGCEYNKDEQLRTPKRRRSRKSVQFADGIKPGEGTSPSGCESDMPSPPPPVPASLQDPLHELVRRSRSRKSRRKAKRMKPQKTKKKVKVKIIKLKKARNTTLTSMMMDDLDEIDDRSPPPPPPGSPPPPHLWPSYLAAYSATLRPVESSLALPNINPTLPPPTPLPLLVPPPPLNYTIQPCNKA